MNDGLERQPLDELMERRSLTNDDLVRCSGEQLTHKQLQKARKGKRVTPNIQGKIVRALNAALGGGAYTQRNLFNQSS
ncbi:MAG TPA: hypothetical protein P5160_08370 [Candidatus Omnitrophota bacterium]|nr:hypothetical protein [Candidatus Omnitrophota bacterium]